MGPAMGRVGIGRRLAVGPEAAIQEIDDPVVVHAGPRAKTGMREAIVLDGARNDRRVRLGLRFLVQGVVDTGGR